MAADASARFNPHFQLGLDVCSRRCLVIGGREEALDKTKRLLDAGARVVVVSKQVSPELHDLAAAGKIELHLRAFKRPDLGRTLFVVNTAVSERRLVEQVWRAARRRKLLINTYDMPSHSTVAMAALLNRGHLRISVSTSNASPALAGKLRRELADLFDDTFEDYLTALGDARTSLRRSEPDRARRMTLLREMVADFRIEGHLRYPDAWRERLEQVKSPSSRPAPG